MAVECDLGERLAQAGEFARLVAFRKDALVGQATDGNAGLNPVTIWNTERLADFLKLDASHAMCIETGKARLERQISPGRTCIEGMGVTRLFLAGTGSAGERA